MSDRPPPAKGPVQGLPNDSPPGEEVVQVNDNHLRDPDPEDDEAILDEQHPTGG